MTTPGIFLVDNFIKILNSVPMNWIKNGTAVNVLMPNGSVIEGVISGGDYNPCTYVREYQVDYLKDNVKRTLIGVPESNVTLI